MRRGKSGTTATVRGFDQKSLPFVVLRLIVSLPLRYIRAYSFQTTFPPAVWLAYPEAYVCAHEFVIGLVKALFGCIVQTLPTHSSVSAYMHPVEYVGLRFEGAGIQLYLCMWLISVMSDMLLEENDRKAVRLQTDLKDRNLSVKNLISRF